MCGNDQKCYRAHVTSYHKRSDTFKGCRDPLDSYWIAAMDNQRAQGQVAANEDESSEEENDEDDAEAGGAVAVEIPELPSEGIETDSGDDETAPVLFPLKLKIRKACLPEGDLNRPVNSESDLDDSSSVKTTGDTFLCSLEERPVAQAGARPRRSASSWCSESLMLKTALVTRGVMVRSSLMLKTALMVKRWIPRSARWG